MKNAKGVTLMALVVYIAVFMIVITIMSTVSSFFFNNITQIRSSPQYIVEFNKFSIFFVKDVKDNSEIKNITPTTLEFGDGTMYEYKDQAIYRDGMKIAKYITSFSFAQSSITQNDFTKKLINVNAVLGNGEESIERNVEFVLKYW